MSLTWIIPLFVFLFGICWGSFLNVWIYRIPEGRSVAGGRSACMNCKHELGPLDLVPIFSFLFLRAKCRYCGIKLSWQYPMVEFIVGLLFVLTYLVFGLDLYAWAISFFLITVNTVMGKIDWDTGFIPNVLSYPSILIAAVLTFFISDFNTYAIFPQPTVLDAWIGGIALLLIFVIMFFVSNGGMGLGDAKWALFIGLLLGWQVGFIAIAIASLTSVLFSGFVMLFFQKKIKELPDNKISKDDETEEPLEGKVLGLSIVNGKPAIVMGPFLAFGMLMAWFFGVNILDWWLMTP